MVDPTNDVFEGLAISEVDLGGPVPSLYERLHDAVRGGCVDKIKQILLENSNNLEDAKSLVNYFPKKRKPLLYIATQSNRTDMIKELKSLGADVMKPDSRGWLPLHLAANNGYTLCCKELLHGQEAEVQDLQLNAVNGDGMLPHMLAAKLGYHSCCEFLVKETNVNCIDKNCNTALIIAVMKDYKEIAELLVRKGANLNHQNQDGHAAVHKAAQLRSPACFKILENNGANLMLKTRKMESVLHLAARGKEREFSLRYLLKNGTVLSVINHLDQSGKTPLYIALESRSYTVAHILLEYKACTKTSVKNVMPIHLAAERGYDLVCREILLQDPLCVDEKNDEGLTPLLIAARSKHPKVCKVLMKSKANVREVDNQGMTALHLALRKGGCVETVRVLLKEPIFIANKNGSTPLHTSVEEKSYTCCKLLLCNYKDYTLCLWEKDKWLRYPIDIAYEKNYEKIFKFLLEKMSEEAKDSHQDLRQRIHKHVHEALEDIDRRYYVVEAVIHSWIKIALEPCEDKGQCSIFQKLIENQPKLAAVVLDQSLAHSDENFQVFEDFHIGYDDTTNTTQDPESCSSWVYIGHQMGDGATWLKKHPVTLMIQKERNDLLQHKLTNYWICDRWQHHTSTTLIILLLFHFMAWVFQLGYMITAWNEHHIFLKYNISLEVYCDPVTVLEGTNPNSPTTTTHFVFLLLYVVTYIIQVILYITYVVMVRRLCRLDLWMKIFELLLMLCVLLPLSHCQVQTGVREDWAWQCGLTAVLLSWMHFLSFANKPYRNPFTPIAKDFFRFLCIWLYYVVTVVLVFAIIFHLLLQEQKVFSNMGSSIMKTCTWMLLDLSYNDTFQGTLPYEFLTNMLFMVFIAIVGCFIASLISQCSSRKKEQTPYTFQCAAQFATMVLEFEVWFLWFRRYSNRKINQGNINRVKYKRSFQSFFEKSLSIGTADDDSPNDKFMEELERILQEQKSQSETIKRMDARMESMESKVNSLKKDITHTIIIALREHMDRVSRR